MSTPAGPEAGRASVRVGREILGDLPVAETREWLVTNGIGGYASGSVAGSVTRGYHGLLVAAVRPPVDRRVLLVKVDETVTYRGTTFELGTNRWAGGEVAPRGHLRIERFELRGSVPAWRFRCADAVLEKSVWMEHGANTTYVAYEVVDAGEPLVLSLAAITDNRVFHNTGQVSWPVALEPLAGGVRVRATDPEAPSLTVVLPGAEVVSAGEVYRGFQLPAEAHRGLNDHDDHVHAATLSVTLAPGEKVVLVASSETAANAALDGAGESHRAGAQERRDARDRMLVERWRAARPDGAAASPDWVGQLVLAADQFVVDRPSPAQPDGQSVIAGYHWFGDWGRDTMISLAGLTLATGRPEVAAPILSTFSRFVSEGMLPNRFPDAGDQPEYNTIDATLWYFQAVRAYHEATGDDALLATLFGVLDDIVSWHIKGTRYGIGVDATDGLLRWDADGVQPTWMDARVGDHVITPRRGKPVEVNALWYNAVRAMAGFARRLGRDPSRYDDLAGATLAGFDRFWNAGTGFCFDVIDGPGGDDPALRPNQLFAVSLPESPLFPERQRAVVDACARTLLTSHGLRSLAPGEAAYVGSYGGDQVHRDGAYHQGTVWAWLIGPFVDAHLRVYDDPVAARRLLDPFGDHLRAAGMGTISEIFDGDEPFAPRGCIAQAWSVAEVLRVLDRVERHDHPSGPKERT